MSRLVYLLGVATGVSLSLPCYLKKKLKPQVKNSWVSGDYEYIEYVKSGSIVKRDFTFQNSLLFTIDKNVMVVHNKCFRLK